jgi:TonB family protein
MPSLVRISFLTASLCLCYSFGTVEAFAFPTLNKDHFMRSSNKEKPPPPLVIRDKWAVLIGLTKYQDGRIPPTKHAVANLAALTKVLRDPNGGRFAGDHITTLFDVQATKKYVEELLTDGWLIKKALPNDLIVLYVCGRAMFTNDDAILSAYDTTAASPDSTGLSLTQLLTEIHRRTQSKNIICIADLSPLVEGTTAPHQLWQMIAGTSKVAILAASMPGQPSYPSGSMGTTLFTHHLVDDLASNGGAMNIQALTQNVCQSTEIDARSLLQKDQRPQYAALNDNQEFGTVAIGMPIKANPKSQMLVKIGHPIDRLAMTRPDLMPHGPRHTEIAEGAKSLSKKHEPDDDDDDVRDVDFSGYMAKMKKDIQAKWKPPKGIEQRKVVVTFSINRDGSIADGSVVQSSGVESIDKSALEALHDASPIDPLPKGAPKSVQIRYLFDWKVSQ